MNRNEVLLELVETIANLFYEIGKAEGNNKKTLDM